MSTSLIDLARQHVTPDVIERLAGFTGETPAATAKAFGGAAPAILAGMLDSVKDPSRLTQLTNLFQQGKFDGSMLNNLAGAYSGSSMDGLMKMGGPLLGSLFGSRSGALTDLIAGYAGVKRTSATALLSAAAPFVMSVMGRQLTARGGINATGLKELLLAQGDDIATAAPPGLARILAGGTAGADAGRTAIGAAAATSPLARLLPVLLGLVLLVALLVLVRTCGRSPATVTPPADTMNTMAPPTPGTPTAPASATGRTP